MAVIGGGVVGHGIAWGARRSGRSVALIDEAPGSGASWAAAGMLAPVSELHYQEEGLLELMLESSARWPEFASTLTTGEDAGYLTTPTLALGADPADRRALMDLRDVQRGHGLEVEPLTIREARSREPLLSPGISCALDIPADHQVDPRKLVRALAAELAGAGQVMAGQKIAGKGIEAAEGFAVREHAAGLLWDGDRVCGVRLAGGGTVAAGETVVANGLAAAHLQNLPEHLQLPLRPVYGDILRLRVPEHLQPLLTATVRGMVRGVPVYIVPRQDGTVVIGATQREDSVPGTSAGGVYQLLRDAQALLPAVAELELLEATARARPGTPDNAPLLGRVPACVAAGVPAGGQEAGGDVPGLIIATGFFRHGVLLTPAAAAICRQLMDGFTDPRWAAFRPARFSPGIPDPLGAAVPSEVAVPVKAAAPPGAAAGPTPVPS